MTNAAKLDITDATTKCNNENCFCGYFNESAVNLNESSPLQVITELNNVYRGLVNKIDSENGDSDLKVQTLLAWIKDLEEQNTVLVETVEQLETEAAQRVALLDERLQQTSRTALRYMTKLQDYDNQLQEIYRKQMSGLQDVKITKEDKGIVTEVDQNIENEIWKKKYHETESELLQTKLQLKSVQKEVGDLRTISSDLHNKKSELQALKDDNTDLQSQLKKEIEHLRLKEHQNSELHKKLDNLEKSYQKEFGELKEEIELKNDKIYYLNSQILKLDEQRTDTLSKMQYKEDIIKQLRNELKKYKSKCDIDCAPCSNHMNSCAIYPLHQNPVRSIYNQKLPVSNESHSLPCSCNVKDKCTVNKERELKEYKPPEIRLNHQYFPEMDPSVPRQPGNQYNPSKSSKSYRQQTENNFYNL